MKHLPLLSILALLVGCQVHTLSDGAKIRVDRFPGLVTPSVTTVSIRPAGSTNWTTPQVISGPSAFGSVGGGVSIIVPTGRNNDVHVNASAEGGNATSSSTATAPRAGFPPGHNKDNRNKGR